MRPQTVPHRYQSACFSVRPMKAPHTRNQPTSTTEQFYIRLGACAGLSSKPGPRSNNGKRNFRFQLSIMYGAERHQLAGLIVISFGKSLDPLLNTMMKESASTRIT